MGVFGVELYLYKKKSILMLENEFYISELIAGRLRGELSPQQEAELNTWVSLSEENSTLFDELKNEEIDKEVKHFLSANRASVWNKTVRGLQDEKTTNLEQPAIHLWPRLVVAAAILLIAGVATFFYVNSDPNKALPKEHVYVSDVAPGHNGATLTLANGKTIKLSDADNGKLATEAGIKITKTADGQLVYELAPKVSQPRNDVPTNAYYNTLSTTNGQQYQVILPDHSKVWLNAASSIKYPSSFAGLENRTVDLNGEAYFEVAKDKTHPFIVKTVRQEVKVLGTHFNVNAYNDDEDTKTTLLEGSVQLNGGIMLKPNEQGISKANVISIKTVNANEAVAWKQGDFIFKNQELTTTMRQIARWYNVEVIYEKDAPKQLKLGGSISRTNPISVVLKAMEKTGKVKFRLEGRRVIVSKV